MYNFALAFVICAILYLAGDAVSNLTKAWVPSVFVTAVLILIGYWTIIPKTLVSDSVLIPFGSTIGIYLLISHMGTVISIAQLIEQWKTIVICLAGLAGMCALSLLVLPGIIGMDLVMSGLPPLTGGIVAATTMQSAAQAASDAAAAAGDAAAAAAFAEAAVFAIVMYCVQGFAGYPLTAICLQLEGKAYLKKYRAGEIKAVKADENLDAESGNFKSVEKKEAKKKQKTIEIKEVRLSPNIEENDLKTKVNNARKFLRKGNKVKVTLRFRGREMAHMQSSKHILDEFAQILSDIAVIEKAPKVEGRSMTMFLTEKR